MEVWEGGQRVCHQGEDRLNDGEKTYIEKR